MATAYGPSLKEAWSSMSRDDEGSVLIASPLRLPSSLLLMLKLRSA